MAGIGFYLKELYTRDTYLDKIKAALFSSLVASGPTIFSIATMVLLASFASDILPASENEVFLVTVVYIFAFSLIVTGATQLVLTRYISDMIYAKRIDEIAPTMSSGMLLTAVTMFLLGLPLYFWLDHSLLYRALAVLLTVIVGCIWQLMVFLSALKNYRVVVFAFGFGLSLGLALGLLFASMAGLEGLMLGYLIGQLGIFLTLSVRVFIEFRSIKLPNFQFLGYIRSLPHLVVVGLCYNGGIWIDKILFWYSGTGVQIDGILHAFPAYDAAMFLAYISVLPSYAHFLSSVETDFYDHFRAFFETILARKPLRRIHGRRMAIAASLRESLSGFFKMQGLITVLCLLYSDELVALAGMPATTAMIFEKALISVLLQMLLLYFLIFMMYFDQRTELMWVGLCFLGSNTLLTLATLALGELFYGYGYLGSCLITSGLAYYYLDRHLANLEYHTFTRQPYFA